MIGVWGWDWEEIVVYVVFYGLVFRGFGHLLARQRK